MIMLMQQNEGIPQNREITGTGKCLSWFLYILEANVSHYLSPGCQVSSHFPFRSMGPSYPCFQILSDLLDHFHLDSKSYTNPNGLVPVGKFQKGKNIDHKGLRNQDRVSLSPSPPPNSHFFSRGAGEKKLISSISLPNPSCH